MAIQFFGAPPMALMTVGTATLLVGERHIGATAALSIDAILWTVGTVLGLVTAVAVPYRLFTRLEVRHDAAFGGWLMPVVPPMVSASAGALLVQHVPGRSVATDHVVRLLLDVRNESGGLFDHHHAHLEQAGPLRFVGVGSGADTVVVLGPVGQSITAAGALGTASLVALDPPLSTGLDVFAVAFGVPMWGFMLLWMPMAAALTRRAAKRKMGFALTWWSFTLPRRDLRDGDQSVGCPYRPGDVSMGSRAFVRGLLLAWITVGVRTLRQSLDGNLLTPPVVSLQAAAQKGCGRAGRRISPLAQPRLAAWPLCPVRFWSSTSARSTHN